MLIRPPKWTLAPSTSTGRAGDAEEAVVTGEGIVDGVPAADLVLDDAYGRAETGCKISAPAGRKLKTKSPARK